MTLQVVNPTLEKFNQFRTTTKTLFQDVKERGWNIKDCKVTELKEELIHTLYRSADGKNCARN
jgi:nucleoside diphosphate kinase